VTLDGDVLRPDGSLTGGVLEGPAVGALQKKREVQERTEEVALWDGRYSKLVALHSELQQQTAQLEDAIAGLAHTQHTEELNLAHQEKDLHKAGEDLLRLRERLEVLDGEAQELQSALVQSHVEEEASRGEVAHGHTERVIREERIRQLASEGDTLRMEAETLSADLMSLKVHAAAHTERSEAARREHQRLQSEASEAQLRMERIEAQLESERVRLEERSRDIAETEAAYEVRRVERDAHAGVLDEARQVHARQAQEVRDGEGQLREVRLQLETASHAKMDCELKDKETALAIAHVVDGVRDRQGLELSEHLHRFHLAAPLDAEAENETRELRAQIEKIGEVNLTAIEEHAEV
jgi:chromosome segregation protein